MNIPTPAPNFRQKMTVGGNPAAAATTRPTRPEASMMLQGTKGGLNDLNDRFLSVLGFGLVVLKTGFYLAETNWLTLQLS